LVLRHAFRWMSFFRAHRYKKKRIFISNMSKDEIKYEINKVLDHFSDEALEELLTFLKQLGSGNNEVFLNSNELQKILSEDKQLLEKLAQ
jgi:hypothetical protein